MSQKIISQFEIPYFQILNEEGKLVDELPSFAKNTDHLLKLYKIMVLNRQFDTKAITLQRTGKLGTYPSACGQEAVFTGIGDALEKTDVFVPYYRDVATLVQRGVKLKEILLFWGGDERGNAFESNNSDFPYSVPIATQLLHAAGAATAIQIRKEKRAVLVTCGDGATSEGDFYEALNVAGTWNLPVVFAVCNNQWAISVARDQQTKAKTLAQKAIAAGFSGEQVDGNDVIAVRERVGLALDKARETKGPTLVELISYRHADHTTADDASRYEPKDLRKTEWQKEPVNRLCSYLKDLGVLTEDKITEIEKETALEIDKNVKEYLNMPKESPEVMMDYLYDNLPDALKEQHAELKSLGETVHG